MISRGALSRRQIQRQLTAPCLLAIFGVIFDLVSAEPFKAWRDKPMISSSKIAKAVIMLMVLTLILASTAAAFNGQRKGFTIGFGVGPGLTIAQSEYKPVLVNTDFRIGTGLSEQFQFYWTAKVSWYSVDRYSSSYTSESITETFGVGGLGISYYFFPTAPSGYATASLGFATVTYPFEHGASEPDLGLGLGMGIGWEFTPHLSLEANLVSGSTSYNGYERPQWSLKVTLNALAY